MTSALSAFSAPEKTTEERIEELEDQEFQLLRMQQNMMEVAKHGDIIGIDTSKHDEWFIIYSQDDGEVCRLMAASCQKAFRGSWDASIHATYKSESIHIDDIRGEPNAGMGSVLVSFLKQYAIDQNVPKIEGKLAERDWDHVDRLIHFYEKHEFDVHVDYRNKEGHLKWAAN
ncbi:hypothetical protein FLK61_31315 [Paenalkalicoccus suaedae]|uniref:N-acetyltransferase n=1 Tax=Paenalkalicoccus suaedae TaxID=2592382 RepID=A0A859FK54_9BACI|nr:hypothetical protein [Paenalkalicoccus suaedae]QKS73230.1 hypothetical protein FLK61_31315 [Paenalkalicoccus suaedae]